MRRRISRFRRSLGLLLQTCRHSSFGSVTVERVLTDNALNYRRGTAWAAVCSALQIKRRFTRIRCPWTNGKAERFNRTLQTEWAYTTAWHSNDQRTVGLIDSSTATTLAAATSPSAATHRSADSPREHCQRGPRLAQLTPGFHGER